MLTHREIDIAVRDMLRRGTLEEVDDSGSLQMLKMRGLASDKPRRVTRLQSFGLTSNPPAGANAVLLALGGRSDRLLALGLEHKDHRPTGIPGGGTALYDASGQIIKMTGDEKTVIEVGTLTIIADQVVIESGDINLGGLGGKPVAVEGTITSDGAVCASNFAASVKAV